jgi:hypothetical protein
MPGDTSEVTLVKVFVIVTFVEEIQKLRELLSTNSRRLEANVITLSDRRNKQNAQFHSADSNLPDFPS